MSARTWLYQRMIGDSALQTLLERDTKSFSPGIEGIFAAKALLNSPGKWPFIVYVMGNDTEEALGENDPSNRQYAMVWVHDDATRLDYMSIDSIVDRLKDLFRDADGSSGVITSHVLETSRDLDDQEMGTNCRYLRLQIIAA